MSLVHSIGLGYFHIHYSFFLGATQACGYILCRFIEAHNGGDMTTLKLSKTDHVYQYDVNLKDIQKILTN